MSDTEWIKVAELDELLDGRVKTVVAGHRSLALSRVGDKYGALDNRCPHQYGPLGEGSIENGWLRCPWHGYDFDPLTGQPPPPFDDAPPCFKTEVRDDGVYVELPPEPAKHRTVSDVLVETMLAWGVDTVFGMVGHSNLGFADAMRKAEAEGKLRFFGIRHEGAAAFAATAYGKLTGELAGCFGIAGPGSTNLLTGLYDAKLDRAPVLAISGQVPSKVVSRGAFQDLDLAAAFSDVSVYSSTVGANSDPAELMNLACKNALVQREVSHLILPDEVQVQPAQDVGAGGPTGRVSNMSVAPPAESLNEAVAKIKNAKRPIIILGAGSRFCRQPVIELAEHIGAPVATTFKAKGLIPDSHSLGCGVLGRSGTPIASWFMNESDLVITFGASFSQHTGIAPYKPIVQVDFDPMAIGRFHSVDVSVLGEVGVTAELMKQQVEKGASDKQRASIEEEVASRWAIWREEKTSRLRDDRGKGIASATLFDVLTKAVDKDAVLCVDVGNNTYSFGRYFEVENQTVLMSGYLGSIGFGFPAAMGSWAYETSSKGSGRQVVSISGDGGFGQYAMELTTAVKYEMNITHILLNNNELGKITKEQRAAELDVFHTSLHNPNFAEFANLCGAKGQRVENVKDLAPAISEALAHKGVSLVEIVADAQLI